MAQLYNPLSKPSQSAADQLSIYLDEVNWASDTNLLTLSVGLLSGVTDITSFGLRLHYDGTGVTYSEDKAYSLTQSQADTIGQGVDNIFVNGIVTGAGHIEVSDSSNYDGSSSTTAFVKTNWASSWDTGSGAIAPWPGATDVDLYDINFTVTNTLAPISFGFSADSGDLKEGYSLSSASTRDFTIDLRLEPGDIIQAITIGHTDSGVTRTLFGDQSLIFVSSETNTKTVAMSSGSLAILSEDVNFTHVELNTANYDHGISISDVVLQLRDIVGLSTLDGKQKFAADIDGSGEVAISDVVSNLRHIVGLDTIEECALVDSTDALVTSLNSSTIADLTLVQYGDVDLSATFLIA